MNYKQDLSILPQNISHMHSLLPLSILVQSTVILCLDSCLLTGLPAFSLTYLWSPSSSHNNVNHLKMDYVRPYLKAFNVSPSHLGLNSRPLSWPTIPKELALEYLHICTISFYASHPHSCYPPPIVVSFLFFFPLWSLYIAVLSVWNVLSLVLPKAGSISQLSLSFSSSEKPPLTILWNHHISTALLISVSDFSFKALTTIFKGFFC